jgi:hypothetical protein
MKKVPKLKYLFHFFEFYWPFLAEIQKSSGGHTLYSSPHDIKKRGQLKEF